MNLRYWMSLSGLLLMSGLLCGHGGVPRYCKTNAGVWSLSKRGHR
jgi:hypothetical protein